MDDDITYASAPPVSTFDHEEALQKLKDIETRLHDENSSVFDLIVTASRRFKVVKYGKVEIKVRAAVPLDTLEEARRLRKEAEGIEDPDVSLLEELKPMYDMLAALCLEDPWNKWETWGLIDQKTNGQARTILGEIIKSIQDSEKKISVFR